MRKLIQETLYENDDERRHLRNQYRQHLEDTEALKRNANVTAKQLSETLSKANELYSHVKGTAEATLDSRALCIVSELSVAQARQNKLSIEAFDVSDYLSRIRAIVTPVRLGQDELDVVDFNSLDFTPLAERAYDVSRQCPTIDFMAGALTTDATAKRVARRVQVKRDQNKKTAPELIQESDVQRSENETSANVRMIDELLQKNQHPQNGIGLLEFIINPESFGQTVENLFYVSFLIKDARASIENAGERLILRATKPSKGDEHTTQRQQVLCIDMATWRTAIEIFNIKTSIIPTRSSTSHQMRLGQNVV